MAVLPEILTNSRKITKTGEFDFQGRAVSCFDASLEEALMVVLGRSRRQQYWRRFGSDIYCLPDSGSFVFPRIYTDGTVSAIDAEGKIRLTPCNYVLVFARYNGQRPGRLPDMQIVQPHQELYLLETDINRAEFTQVQDRAITRHRQNSNVITNRELRMTAWGRNLA